MSGRIVALVVDTIQIYFLISMKRTLLFALQSISFVRAVQFPGNALLLAFLKKNGESGEVSFLKVEKSLENLLNTEVKSSGLKLGRA